MAMFDTQAVNKLQNVLGHFITQVTLHVSLVQLCLES